MNRIIPSKMKEEATFGPPFSVWDQNVVSEIFNIIVRDKIMDT
jgi:hypothetical protein